MLDKDRERVALFRFGVISDLVTGVVPDGQREAIIQHKSGQLWEIPGKGEGKVGRSTIRDWVQLYQQGGLQALEPTVRSDRGQSRALRAQLAEQIVQLREDRPSRSVQTIVKILHQQNALAAGEKLAPSTVYRLLRDRGLSGRRRASQPATDRRRFSFAHAGDLWQADAMHGPQLRVPGIGRQRKAYLIGIMDDATRMVAHAAFCWQDSLNNFLSVFKTALLRRGIPRRLFVDNGRSFSNLQIERICAELGIALIHARPYSSQSKGKIERFWSTVRSGFLPEVDLGGINSLDSLNQLFMTWCELDYHRTPHRGLEATMTPLDAWMKQVATVRQVDGGVDLDTIFLHSADRRVYDDRTVHLLGRIYEAPAELCGLKVQLRYDPEHPEQAIRLFCKGRPVGEARPLDAVANSRVRRERPQGLQVSANAPSPKVRYVQLLARNSAPADEVAGSTPEADKEKGGV